MWNQRQRSTRMGVREVSSALNLQNIVATFLTSAFLHKKTMWIDRKGYMPRSKLCIILQRLLLLLQIVAFKLSLVSVCNLYTLACTNQTRASPQGVAIY